MFQAFTPFIIAALGIGVILGLVRPARVAIVFLRLIFGPVVIAVLLGLAASAWAQLSLLEKAGVVAVAPVVVVALVLWFLPRDLRMHLIGAFIYDALRVIVTLPMRLLGGLFRAGRSVARTVARTR